MSQTISNQLQKVLDTARLSPSSHNTQPWTVNISGSKLVIGYQPNRKLPIGDPSNRELYISLGCFIETAIYAGKSLGLSASYTFKGKEPDRIAEITFTPSKGKTEGWLETINNRRSDRRLYDKKPLRKEDLKTLSNLRRGGAGLKMFVKPDEIAFLADMTYESTYRVMSNPLFRTELSSWIRNNWTKRPDGMPGYAQGIPGPVSLIGAWFVKNVKIVPADQAKKDAKRVRLSSAIGLIYSNEQTPSAWIDAGRVYAAVCLVAEQAGIKTAGVSAAVVDESTNKQIQKKMGLQEQPVALLRFGYKKGRVRATPRRSVSQIEQTI